MTTSFKHGMYEVVLRVRANRTRPIFIPGSYIQMKTEVVPLDASLANGLGGNITIQVHKCTHVSRTLV